jgi:hypothetical protein
MNLIQLMLDWSEVWALLIPLIVLLIHKPRGNKLGFVSLYVIIALVLNFIAVFTIEFYYLIPEWVFTGNGLYYNLHSFTMVICFTGYFIGIRKYKYSLLLKSLLLIYLVFVFINFSFLESPVHRLSTRHFTAGSIVLLVICLFYFFRAIVEESQANWLKHPSFLICTAVCLYQSITFFIFLFIYPMFDLSYNQNMDFADLMMKTYQLIFVIFCILLAWALFRSKKLQLIKI